jgi:hypothetical protein
MARRSTCFSNLRQIGQASMMYLNDHQGRMPWVPDEWLQLAWTVGTSVPSPRGWSAHNGGRNQLCLDLHADWVRRDIDR